MIRTFILCAFLLLSGGLRDLHAQRIPDNTLHELIRRGIHFSGQQNYASAMGAFDRAIASYPEHPAGFLNKAILLMVMSLDFEVPVEMPKYLELLEKVEKMGARMSESSGTAAEGLYYLGMARSYIAYYHFRDGENWLSGLSHGLKATGYLEDCLEKNPRAYDAMTGVGTYKYWKSRNMSFLTWTPLVDDERHAGINLLRLSEIKADYTAQQATNSLIWIYIEEERWNDAIRSANGILRRFPTNRLFLWGLASAAEGKEDWALAREAYRRIVASIDAQVSERRYIEIQARAKIASMSYELGDRRTAKQECEWVLRQRDIDLSGFTADGSDRIQRRIEEMEELKEKL
ncbi:MAG: tetratricopeptide repeat protein [Bacteroidetes bacterium]|nr:tetratricopeptide repeat protein [Bacteroidota bacterium]